MIFDDIPPESYVAKDVVKDVIHGNAMTVNAGTTHTVVSMAAWLIYVSSPGTGTW